MPLLERVALTSPLLLTAVLASCVVEHGMVPDGGAEDAAPEAFDVPPLDAPPPPDAPPAACEVDAECNDLLYCNGVERCVDGSCSPGTDPCDDGVTCSADSCTEASRSCSHTPDDTLCDDGSACNGVEACDLRAGCVGGAAPDCRDDDPCTEEACQDPLGCVYRIRDVDEDGHGPESCGGDDCDDSNDGVNPLALENCANGRDDDCDGRVDIADTSCLATNDRCESATAMEAPGSYPGTTRGLRAETDYPGDICGLRSGAPDGYFAFTLTERTSVSLEVRSADPAAAQSVRLYPASSCASGPPVRCDASGAFACRDCFFASGDSTASIRHSDLAPGDYVVAVTSSSATYVLSYDESPAVPLATSDSCTGPTIDVSAGGTFAGSYFDATDDIDLPCGDGGHDVALRLSLTSARDVTLRLRNGTGVARLALVPACDVDAALACREYTTPPVAWEEDWRAGELVHTARAVPPGDYRVILEDPTPRLLSHAGEQDDYTWSLDVELTAPTTALPGDECDLPIPLGTSVDLEDFTNTTPSGCAPEDARTVFYRLVVPTTSDVVVSATASRPVRHYEAVSMALTTPCSTTAIQGCYARVSLDTDGPYSIRRIHSVPAGTYDLMVAGPSDISLTVTATLSSPTPVPSNINLWNGCPVAVPIPAAGLDHLGGTSHMMPDEYRTWAEVTPPGASWYTLDLASTETWSFSTIDAYGDPTGIEIWTSCGGTGFVTSFAGSGIRTLDPGFYSIRVTNSRANYTSFAFHAERR